MTRRELVVVAAVLVVGYSLYGVAFVVGAGVASVGTGATVDGNATAATADESGPAIRFTPAAERAGFEYAGVRSYAGTQAVMSNAGVYATDYDGDGWTDLLAVGGDRPVLFENRGGEFRPSGALSGVERPVLSALFFDYDTDGDDDLLLLTTDREPLFLENTGGAFEVRDVGFETSFEVPVGATAGDYDGDGCPDVFVIQNGDWTDRHPAGERNYTVPEGQDNGNPNYLYRGDCAGFERVEDAGISGTKWSLTTSMVDLDGDGRQDIHVANDYNHDVVYYNEGDGSFQKRRLGERTNRNGMSSEILDVNGDARPDIFVTNIWFPRAVKDAATATMGVRSEGNNLLVNAGDREFVERAEEYGVRRGGFAWAATASDFDNDGDSDLFHATRRMVFRNVDPSLSSGGAERIHTEFPVFLYPAVYERRGDGYVRLPADVVGFEETDGRGVAALDFDNDGDRDLAVASTDGPFRLYENTVESPGRSVGIRVRNSEGTALGARVSVTAGPDRQTEFLTAGTDFLSQDSRTLHFGVGNNTRVDVRVVWPDGTERVYRNLGVGARYTVTRTGFERVEYAPGTRP